MHNKADIVRLLLGDRSSTPALTDTEIEILLEESGDDAYWAAWLGANVLSAINASAISASVDGVSISSGDLSLKYSELGKRLYTIAAMRGNFQPFAGGVYKSHRDAVEADTSLVRPYFRRDIHRVLGSVHNDDLDS